MSGDDSGTWIDGLDDEPSAGSPVPTVDEPRYRLGEEVARGRIVRAYDVQLDRDVAVKTLLRATAVAEARFEREVRLTARLQHPNIVPVFDRGRLPDDEAYLAMRLVHGRSQGDVIQAAEGLAAGASLPCHRRLTDR